METCVDFCRKLSLFKIDSVCMTAKSVGGFVDVDIMIRLVQGPQSTYSSRAAADNGDFFPAEAISRGTHCIDCRCRCRQADNREGKVCCIQKGVQDISILNREQKQAETAKEKSM